VLNPPEAESPYWSDEWMAHKITCKHGSCTIEPALASTFVQGHSRRMLTGTLGRRRRGTARQADHFAVKKALLARFVDLASMVC